MSKIGKIIWFTGLSGSGKTTLAGALRNELLGFGKTCEILDGDAVRSSLNRHLGFSRADIRENNKLLAELALEKSKKYDFVLVSAISPFREDRAMARSLACKNFIELFVDCSLEKCIERDVKGLYKKALAGEINNFIGVSASNPYEIPENPDFAVKTVIEPMEESLSKLLAFLGFESSKINIYES